MADEIAAFNPIWVKNKKGIVFSKNFQRIIEFYVFSTPCESLSSSSSGISNERREWGDKPWVKTKLREYLLSVAELQVGVNYIRATGRKKDPNDDKKKIPSNMQEKIKECKLDGKFHLKRKPNKIVFALSGQHAEFIDIFFYIRCAFAHGRFQIYNVKDDPIYVMEAAKKKDEKEKGKAPQWYINARMILKESTLLKWADIIDEGLTALQAYHSNQALKLGNDIIELISEKHCVSKKYIVDKLSPKYQKREIYKTIDTLRKDGKILYSHKQFKWLVNN